MKLFKIWQDVNSGYDTYDSAVVAAKNKKQARWIHPSSWMNGSWDGNTSKFSEWCSVQDVQVEYLGEAKEGTKAGVIVASYDAG